MPLKCVHIAGPETERAQRWYHALIKFALLHYTISQVSEGVLFVVLLVALLHLLIKRWLCG